MNDCQPSRRLPRRLLITGAMVAALIAIGWWFWPRNLATIGVEGRYEVTIVGRRITAIPYTHGDALAVRIAAVEPTDGGYRYDLRYMAYGPGEHDLRDYLVDSQRRQPAGLPEMIVSVGALLPADYSGTLFDAPGTPIDLRTNYRLGMALLWCLWGLLLVPLLLYGRKSRSSEPSPRPLPSPAERLRALLQRAADGELSVEQQADLDQLLLVFWTQRLHVATDRLATTLDELRKHPAAARQVEQVERWLHGRGHSARCDVVQKLLAELGWNEASAISGDRA